MRYVTKAWVPVIISVLCAVVLFASLDRVPDPPAIKPQHVAAHVSSFHLPVHPTPAPTLFPIVRVPASFVQLVVLLEASAQAPNARQLLMRQAGDASPPTPPVSFSGTDSGFGDI
jgi:hypothetical protein